MLLCRLELALPGHITFFQNVVVSILYPLNIYEIQNLHDQIFHLIASLEVFFLPSKARFYHLTYYGNVKGKLNYEVMETLALHQIRHEFCRTG